MQWRRPECTDCGVCRVCFASLVSSAAQAARKPVLRAFHAEALVRPLLRMARYSNSTMQSAAFLALGNLMSYPAAQQCLCEVIRHTAITLPKHFSLHFKSHASQQASWISLPSDAQ